MRIAFRADSSRQIGSGHIARCLTLALCLQQQGEEVLFLSRAAEGDATFLVRESGIRLYVIPPPENKATDSPWLPCPWQEDIAACLPALQDFAPDWLVIDHYAVDCRWEQRARESLTACSLMVIDDLGDRRHDCDILLDQNYRGNNPLPWKDLCPPSCKIIQGPSFALLRPEFSMAPARPRRDIRRLNLSFGGSDPDNVTGHVLEAIAHSSLATLEIDVIAGASNPHREELARRCAALPAATLHVQTSRMAELLSMADLAIGAGGSTLWERAACGVPVVAFTIAGNQRQIVRQLHQDGLIVAVPEDYEAGRLPVLLESLVAWPSLLEAMALRFHAVCEGRGTSLVARALRQLPGVTVRPAGQDDCMMILEWRNHPQVRSSSLDPSPITEETHRHWFSASLADPYRLLLLGSCLRNNQEDPVGVVRIDFSPGDHTARISIFLAPGATGQGLGRALLQAGEEMARQKFSPLDGFLATILDDNTVSQNMFRHQGYQDHACILYKPCH